jgi:hypothetical protein
MLLKNGKVLIAGGGNLADVYSMNIYASAELYDPATGTFSPTGSMSSARENAIAVLLADGSVLIAGGLGCAKPNRCTGVAGGGGADVLASAEIYNPNTGKFTPTGSMAEGRQLATATLLGDRKVLLAGWGKQAEIYDPDSGRFARIGPEGPLTGDNTATLLGNGRVLVTGMSGYDLVAQLFDESSRKFTSVSLALPAHAPIATYQGKAVPRSGPTLAILLHDGRVLLFDGGYLETYDPTTGECADAGFISPAGQWFYPNATLMPDGKVLFEGGGFGDGAPSQYLTNNIGVLYDPMGGPSRTGSTPLGRIHETVTLLPSGSVLFAGGQDVNMEPVASAQLITP